MSRKSAKSLADSGNRAVKILPLRPGPWGRLLLLALGSLFLLLFPAAARAAKPRVAILPFAGPAGEDVENPIIEVIPRGYTLVPLELVDKAVRPFGKRLPVTSAFYMAMARRLAAAVVIDGRTSNDLGWKLRMTVRRAASGTVAGTVDFRGNNRKELEANVRVQAPSWLQTLLDKAVGAAPAPGEPGRAPEPPRLTAAPRPGEPPRLKPPAPSEAGGDGAERAGRIAQRRGDRRADDGFGPGAGNQEAGLEGEPLEPGNADEGNIPEDAPLRWEISVGPRVISRAFVFTDNVAGLPGYSLPGTTGVSGEATFFPAAHSRGSARHFGFSGEWTTSVGAKTLGRDGARSYPTRSLSYRLGPRYQMRRSNLALSFGVDYGNHQFQLEVTETLPPNVDYTFLRPSVATQLDVAAGVSLRLEAAYLHMLSVGGLGDDDRFPRISSVGAEVGAMVGYAIDSDFEVRLSASLRHYAHNMHAKPGDRYIVGGAVDEHFGGGLLITYRIR